MISLKSGLLIILLLLPGLAIAQNGQISGQVTDAVTGQPLPGVNVIIHQDLFSLFDKLLIALNGINPF